MPSSLLGRLSGGVIRVAGPLLAVLALLTGLIVAGQWARERLRPLERYHIAFTAIDCATPPGSTHGDFLTEVQYLGGLPDHLALLDADLPERLGTAFGRHPWVEKVERVEVQEQTVCVRLMFRKPALVVAGFNRVVDRHGVLLPATAPSVGLPVLEKEVKPPAGAAGTSWGDKQVTAAARGTGTSVP